MAVQTPITNSTVNSISGDQRLHLAKFSSVGNNDTYLAPVAVINAISAEAGNTATVGVTWVNAANGATITFAIASGPATNVTMSVLGF